MPRPPKPLRPAQVIPRDNKNRPPQLSSKRPVPTLRVAPGLAAPVLAAYLRSCGARLKTQEEYFIDDTYRPNPLEYRPNAVVLELTVAP